MELFVKDKSFYKKVVAISLPIAGQQLITVGVNMMDTLMLGQVGEVAMSASAMATQVHTLFQIMCMGMGMGASVLISRYWGANEEKSLRKALALMYRFCLVISLLYTAVVGLVPAAIMRLLTPEEIVIQEGVRYLKWALPCFFLHGFSLVTTIVFRNIKKMHIPFRTSCVAFFVNIFFNWVFIFGKLGAPAMGVAGAALGTLISRAVEFSLNCGMFFFGEKDVPFRIRDIFAPCRDLLPEYIRISLPVLISDTLRAAGLEDGVYDLGGQDVTVKGPVATIDNGALAGSVSDLMRCLYVAVKEMDIPLVSAVKAATQNPARAIGLEGTYGTLAAGAVANAVLLDKETLEVKQVVLRGQVI